MVTLAHTSKSYREDLFVGYKHYQARGIAPLFPFGFVHPVCLPFLQLTFGILRRFGLSYTKFSLSNLAVSRGRWTSAQSLYVQINVTVQNEGDRAGSEVVQLYVSLPDVGLTTPRLQLKGFAKAHNVSKGGATKVTINLDKYAFSFWDESQNCWKIAAGKYGLHVGTSSDNLPLYDSIDLKETFTWKGL